ncbi:hypothetical protein SNEBB_010045 [Seison nebaliae]|nr:hypothetical protein SNEBB_010045 [Seison nebaliae]
MSRQFMSNRLLSRSLFGRHQYVNRTTINFINQLHTRHAKDKKKNGNTITTNLHSSDISNANEHQLIDFNNAQLACIAKTTPQLFQAYLVFRICKIKWIVDNQKTIIEYCRKLLPSSWFRLLMKSTFYGHFVGGETPDELKSKIDLMRSYGVKSIFDYSAEEDIDSTEAIELERQSCQSELVDDQQISSDIESGEGLSQFKYHDKFADRRQGVGAAKTYFYEGEEQCDKNMRIFLSCIDAVSGITNATGFCAVKLTALGRPQLLLQLSEALAMAKLYLLQLKQENNKKLFSDVPQEDAEFVTTNLNDVSDSQQLGIPVIKKHGSVSIYGVNEGKIFDLYEWQNLLDPKQDFRRIFTRSNISTGRLSLPGFTPDELVEMRNVLKRLDTVVRHAVSKDVRLMIDAEQSYFQPAIRRLTIELMREYNKEKPIVFNTYQCYLQDAMAHICEDLELSAGQDFYFGCKLVRGAYMEHERARAAEIGYDDPIQPSYEGTTLNYETVFNTCIDAICNRQLGKVSVMCATHNSKSVEDAIMRMKECGIGPNDKIICFGQLYGMCDHISYTLGQMGYSVYKYVPYGPMDEVLPYLSRRAEENASIFGGLETELTTIRTELQRRLFSNA